MLRDCWVNQEEDNNDSRSNPALKFSLISAPYIHDLHAFVQLGTLTAVGW